MRQPMLNMRHATGGPTQPAAATVSSEYLRVLALGVEGRGLDLRPIFASARIHSALLNERGARVGAGVADRVWNQLAARLRDPGFGLKLVETIPFGGLDFMDYLVRSSPDVGTALGKVARFAPLMSDAETLSLVVSDRQASLRVQPTCASPYAVEMIIGLFTRRSRDLFGPSWSLKQVSFGHEALGPRADYERLCQAPIRFGMPFTEAVFDRDLLSLPMEGADARLNAILSAQADGLLATVARAGSPRSFVETIQQALSNGLSVGDFTLLGLADHLGVGARTLQRRLRAEGLTHRSLVRKLRHDFAMRSLTGKVTQKQIARALGYSGAGAFQRAFKGWSGVTPAQLRGKSKKGGQPRARRRRGPTGL